MLRKVVQRSFLLLLFFLFETSYAQKILLEYMDGREIVIYTPNYKLLLLAELETGDEIPVGSIIETGRKSTCEFRLVPDGTIIKVADRTTFKIEELQGTDSQGKNQFKLISGAVRAVTGKKPSGNDYVFISGSSTVYPDKADFGVTVKEGWEEIPFVLDGKVRYVNAQGMEITLTKDQMAGGLDENFQAQPMSIRIKRLANSLAFSSPKPQDTGRYGEETSEPTERPTDTPEPGITPLITESPGIAPTPEPVVTAAPTPLSTLEPEGIFPPEPAEETDGKEKEQELEKKDAEKTQAAFDPTREELYPADQYAFTATYTDAFNLKIQEVNDEFVIISFAPPEAEKKKIEEKNADMKKAEEKKVEEEKGVAEQPKAVDSKPETAQEIPKYTLFEIYNVFENKSTLSGKEVYSGFVDSVYLARIQNKIFYFSFLWDGAKKNIKPGFYLYPTGKIYSPEEDKIITIEEKEKSGDSAEGKVVVMEEELDFSGESGRSTDKEKKESPIGFGLDTGMNLSFIVYEPTMFEGVPIYLWLFITARLRYFINASIRFTNWFALGADAGVAIMYLPLGFIDVFFIDIPLRGFLRFGSKNTYFQPFCGYYLTLVGASMDSGDSEAAIAGALEVGASVSIGGFYLEGSYIFGELSGGSNYVRAGIGIVLNDILGKKK